MHRASRNCGRSAQCCHSRRRQFRSAVTGRRLSENHGPAILTLVNSSADFAGGTFSSNTGVITCKLQLHDGLRLERSRQGLRRPELLVLPRIRSATDWSMRRHRQCPTSLPGKRCITGISSVWLPKNSRGLVRVAVSILRLSTEKRSSVATSLKENLAQGGTKHVPPSGTAPAQRQVLGFGIYETNEPDVAMIEPGSSSLRPMAPPRNSKRLRDLADSLSTVCLESDLELTHSTGDLSEDGHFLQFGEFLPGHSLRSARLAQKSWLYCGGRIDLGPWHWSKRGDLQSRPWNTAPPSSVPRTLTPGYRA